MTPQRLRDIAARILMQCIELHKWKRMPEVPCDGCIADWRDLREHADMLECADAAVGQMSEDELAALPDPPDFKRKNVTKPSKLVQ
jgi:hypothetical protein